MVCGGWDTEPASTKKSGGEDRFLFLYGVASRYLVNPMFHSLSSSLVTLPPISSWRVSRRFNASDFFAFVLPHVRHALAAKSAEKVESEGPDSADLTK